MIQPGSTLAHYEIVSALGKGGMGEVWRARDSKLGREVAIKTLPGEFAQDEERLARFEREAKLLASLNHPNIATIHGLEDHNGTRFLVLELVEGDTLADRLKHGAIPVEESLKLALQIAEALEAAHEKGVIHRDLKPANIKVTADGKVKVLDFGLAKAFAGDSDVDLSQSPTISAAATQQGIVLGTAAYMSPEQARGLAVDKRADVWAFGCVLYEMLTGRPVFAGDDVSLTLARVLERQPEFKSLPTNVHPKLLELLERCLEKEAKNRWHDIADVRVDIQKVLADPGGVMVQRLATLGQAVPQSRLPWVVAVLGILVAGVAGWYLKPEPPPEPRPVTRFDYELPEGQQFRGTARPVIALSPDGSSFVYNASGGLYLRSMDDLEARLIPGTEEGLTDPFLSPDGLWVGYWSGTDGQLKKVAVSGGAAVTLCDATNPFDARWSADDTIVFGQPEGIMRVSANGGTPELVVERAEDANIGKPQILPDGQSVLFSGGGQVEVQSLETGARKVLVPNGVAASYVRTGHLVYAVEGVLFGVPFDLANLEVTGGPVPLVEGVWSAGQVVHYDVSDRGSLVYVVGSGSATADRILALVDRSGGVERLNVRPAPYMSPRLSPDGMQLAVQTLEGDGQDVVWVYDLSGDTAIRQLTQEGNNSRPIWTPDGERLTFASDRDGTTSIWWQPADGSGVAEPLTTAQEGVQHWPESWSPDGRMRYSPKFRQVAKV